LDWSVAAVLSDEELEHRLYPPPALVPAAERPEVDWAGVHSELKRKGVTLRLLWEEYREREPRGYGYSRYCELYGRWRGRADLSMRQVHRAGEKLFVDYSGATVPVVDASTREVREAQVFVAVWGASNYTTRRRHGARVCRTGSARTCELSSTQVACRRWWCPTT
jgi:transposase